MEEISDTREASVVTLFDSMFETRPLPVVVVSSYDGSITYASRNPDLAGQHIAELTDICGVPDWHNTPVGRVLGGDGCVVMPDPGNPQHYVVASRLVDDEVFTTVHQSVDEAAAVQEHGVMALRAAAALELAHIRRLNRVALQMLTDSQQHMDRLQEQILAAGWEPPAPRQDSD